MKKLKFILLSIVALIMIPLSVNAASGTIKVTGSSQVVVGNRITLTVTLSSSTSIGSWQMNLNYDKSYLQLTSTNSEAGGTMMANSSATGVKTKTYTFTFKALKSGSTRVSIDSYLAYAFDDLSKMDISTSSKTVKIITQEELEASYSKDNNLKSLSVEGFELSPAFSKDVTEYTVTVPEDTKEVTINATENDSAATVSGTGTFEVTQGTNTFQIVVRAENGSEKTYTVTVDVTDSNPINVTIDGDNYTVVKIKEFLPSANAYTETTVKISDFDIPAYTSELTGFTLVGLKDSAGNIALYIYDADNNSYTAYNELKFNQLTIYPKKTDNTLDGYELGTVTINDIEVPAYYTSSDSRFAIIYGINVETGEEGFFKYDKTDQSIQKYDDEMINSLLEKIKLYSYIIIGFSVILVIMFIILITKGRGKKKKKKDIKVEKVEFKDESENVSESKEEKTEQPVEENKIEEVINEDFKLDEEIYDNVNNKKKTKKKKKK